MAPAHTRNAYHLEQAVRTRPSAHSAWTALLRSPASIVLYGIIVATSVTQVFIGPEAAHRVTEHVSTNLANLLALRWPVLVASAFWLEGPGFLQQLGVWFVLFLIVLVPAERWLGTRRWVLAFLLAHVGATVVTAFRLWLAVELGHQPHADRHAVDVGLSYGFLGVLALQVYRLPVRWRWAAAAALLVPLFLIFRIDRQFTDAGHVMAVLIGFLMYPIARAAQTATAPAVPGAPQLRSGPVPAPASPSIVSPVSED